MKGIVTLKECKHSLTYRKVHTHKVLNFTDNRVYDLDRTQIFKNLNFYF